MEILLFLLVLHPSPILLEIRNNLPLTSTHQTAGVGELQFSLWESDTQRSHEGLLLVSINGGPRKNVCRLKGNVFWYPDFQSARYICQRLGFHHVVDTFSIEGRLPFRLHYRPGIYKLECQNTTSCTYLDNVQVGTGSCIFSSGHRGQM